MSVYNQLGYSMHRMRGSVFNSIAIFSMPQTNVQSIGIDVSKAKLDIAIVSDDQSVITKTVTNTPTGIEELIVVLQQQRTAETVPCVIESTGDYHLLCSVMLAQAKFRVNVINPLITKQYQKSSIRQAKSDRVDAERLAKIGLLEPNLRIFTANLDGIVGKKLVSLLAQLEKVHQRLHASYKQFTTTQAVLQFMTIDLSEIEHALHALQRSMDSIKKTLVKLAPPEIHALAETIPGVSTHSLAIVFCSLADKHFSHRDQLVAFVGLDVRARRSGQWQGQEHLSKRGNGFIRKVLHHIAWGLKMHNAEYQKYYKRLYHEQGKHYTTTLIAIARKFLRYLFSYYWKSKSFPQPVC